MDNVIATKTKEAKRATSVLMVTLIHPFAKNVIVMVLVKIVHQTVPASVAQATLKGTTVNDVRMDIMVLRPLEYHARSAHVQELTVTTSRMDALITRETTRLSAIVRPVIRVNGASNAMRFITVFRSSIVARAKNVCAMETKTSICRRVIQKRESARTVCMVQRASFATSANLAFMEIQKIMIVNVRSI